MKRTRLIAATAAAVLVAGGSATAVAVASGGSSQDTGRTAAQPDRHGDDERDDDGHGDDGRDDRGDDDHGTDDHGADDRGGDDGDHGMDDHATDGRSGDDRSGDDHGKRGHGGDDGDERTAVRDARTSAADAVAAALKARPGTVESIEMDGDHGRAAWELDVLAEDGTWRDLTVDPANGKVLADHRDRGDDDDRADLRGARTDAADAIRAALDARPGKVTEAELEAEHGRTVWEVDVLTGDGTTYRVTVDAAQAHVLGSRAGGDD